MSATYDPTTLSSNTTHAVRFVIGDVDVPGNAQMTDEEIAYEVASASGDVSTAALVCVRRLQARYAVLTDTTEGDVSKKYSQLFDHFAKLAADLTDATTSGGGAVAPAYAGAISMADVRTRELNSDRVAPAFGDRLSAGAWPYGRGW